MKKMIVKSTLCAAVLVGIAACASRSTTPVAPAPAPAPVAAGVVHFSKPTTQPILADIPATTQPAEPALPPGHPVLPKQNATAGEPQLPSGHPAIGGKKAGPLPPGRELPAGHPTVPDGQASAAASTQPAKVGSLVIQTKQGTANGPAIGSDAASIELYADGKSLGKFDTKLAADGALRLEGIPLDQPVQPVVTVTHAGVDYTAPGDVLDAEHASEKVELTVYESTETVPAWSVKMRHVMVRSTPEAVEVTEMLSVDNPGDRAWLGNANGKGGHTTFAIALPGSAKDVKLLSGFHDCCTTTDGGKVTNSMAIVPGSSQYAFSYVIPGNAGKAEVTITAPVAVGHLMVFVPEDSTTVTATGLNPLGSMPMENGQKMRAFMGMNLAAEQSVGVTISNLAKATPAKTVDAKVDASPVKAASAAPQRLAIGGAVLILVLGALVMVFVRSPKTVK